MSVNKKSTPRAAFCIPFFGAWPVWIPLFLQSAGRNPCADFIFFTDLPMPDDVPRNVRKISMSMPELENLVREMVHPKFKIQTSHKICDLKPAYGALFAPHLGNYDFWGYCDIDLVFGDLSRVINSVNLADCDFFTADRNIVVGHFSLFRNNRANREIYKKIKLFSNNLLQWETQCNDEFGMEQLISAHPEFRSKFADNIFESQVSLDYKGEVVGMPDFRANYVKDGKTYVVTKSWQTQEVLYIHFMGLKRPYHWLRYDPTEHYFNFSFSATGFLPWLNPPTKMEFVKEIILRCLMKMIGSIRLFFSRNITDEMRITLKRFLRF